MEKNGIFLVVFVLSLLALECIGGAEPEVKNTDSKTTFDPNKNNSTTKASGSNSVLASAKVDQEEKGAGHNGESQREIKNDSGESNSSVALDSKEGSNKDHSSKKSQGKETGGKKKESNEGLKPKMLPKEGTSGEVSESSSIESSREECDPSKRCTDEKKTLVACLRVPGSESPDLSLLIQNKGKGPLTVKIAAADFVHLEKTTVQLQEKEDQKVIVSIGSLGDNTSIVLTSGNGRCNLDFRDLITHNPGKKIDFSPKSVYTNLLRHTPSIMYVSSGALLLMVLAWMCVKLRRKHLPSDGSRYQKLEMELPISGVGKTESEVSDGWDNSWGDSWDDEEAPKTPSMPVTPSLSSKGLASRRLNKEGWKD